MSKNVHLPQVHPSQRVKRKTFPSIGVEIAALCNRTCWFCPNSSTKRPEQFMSVEMFDHVIEDLVKMKWNGRLEFYMYNEPTRDPRLPDFIRRTRHRLPRVCTMINTNGDYFQSANDIAALFRAGLNQMEINVYCAAETGDNEPDYCATIKRHEQLQKWVDELKLDQESSVYWQVGAEKKVCRVVKKYGQWRGRINRSGLTGTKSSEHSNSVCTKPFRFLNVNWRGDVVICCNDYHSDLVVGNVMERSLMDLWMDPLFRIYRAKLQEGRRDIWLCDGCDFAGGAYKHRLRREEDVPRQITERTMINIEDVRAAAREFVS